MFSACALNGSHRAGGVLDCSESISDYEYLINQSMASMSFSRWSGAHLIIFISSLVGMHVQCMCL